MRTLSMWLAAAINLVSYTVDAAPSVEQLVAITLEDNRVTVRNTSDRYIEAKVGIRGTNFAAPFACETTVYLGPRRSHTLGEVKPKDQSAPLDYRISIVGFTTKTLEQLRAERGNKAVPTPTPVSPQTAGRIERLTCEAPAITVGEMPEARQNVLAAWLGLVRAKIRANMLLPAGLTGNPEVRFAVEQTRSGEIVAVQMMKSSGNQAYDEAMERAILKSSPLPRMEPPELYSKRMVLTLRARD